MPSPAVTALLARLGPITMAHGDDPTVLTMSVALVDPPPGEHDGT
jgi:hypothetical protein